ncbi:hypothetical protein Tco_0772600 [Tanacetum coccineum]|uniref:Uncharacterized protein n=1 Tax=Tanacetum coccineum TaxID=301880 RepID=A0ABQ4ZIC7_9ASTR
MEKEFNHGDPDWAGVAARYSKDVIEISSKSLRETSNSRERRHTSHSTKHMAEIICSARVALTVVRVRWAGAVQYRVAAARSMLIALLFTRGVIDTTRCTWFGGYGWLVGFGGRIREMDDASGPFVAINDRDTLADTLGEALIVHASTIQLSIGLGRGKVHSRTVECSDSLRGHQRVRRGGVRVLQGTAYNLFRRM